MNTSTLVFPAPPGLRQGESTPITTKTKKNPQHMVVLKDASSEKHSVQARNVSPQLFRTKGRWPFDLYPDELILEEKRLILKTNSFPWSSYIVTMPLDKIAMFEISHSWFFSAIYIQGSWGIGIRPETITIRWLHHADAQKAKDIIDGLKLQTTSHVEINTNSTNQEVADTLEEMGKM